MMHGLNFGNFYCIPYIKEGNLKKTRRIVNCLSNRKHLESIDLTLKSNKLKTLYQSQLKVIIRLFLQIFARGQNDFTALHFASFSGNLIILQLLIQNGSRIDSLNTFNRTPLHIACLNNKYEAVQLLIKEGADINKQDNDLNTALHIATQNVQPLIIEILLQKNADIFIKNQDNKYPYQLTQQQSILKIYQKYNPNKQSLKSTLVNSFKRFISQDDPDSTQNRFSQQKYNCSYIKIENKDSESKIGPDSFKYYEVLGKGSFGEVYLVQYKGNRRFYAMKLMKKSKMMKPQLKKYALAEKQALEIMDHPFIVRLNYAFQTDTKLVLVMDYCPGGNLAQLLDDRGRLSEPIAKVYIAEILLALEALHQKSIIFRDLKPENVVLDREGHAMLTDFGLSKLGIDEGSKTDSFCGSPAYMAPEIINRQGHNRQVDWYLLGVLTYELLVGIPPYYADNREDLFENIKYGKLKLPKFLSKSAINFIAQVKNNEVIKIQLLDRNPTTRMGSKRDAEEIREHDWLQNIEWQKCYEKLKPYPSQSYGFEQIEEDNKQQETRNMEGWSYNQPGL